MLDRMAGQGVDATRIEFVAYQPRGAYLETYHRIDICLDTLPYNGHTTSLDAYWMGVPVVTQVGSTVAGRAGWSQLNNLGLTELAAGDSAGFVEIAAVLAADLPRLDKLRQTLRSRMQQSPLMNARRFAKGLEEIFTTVHQAALDASPSN
jgi:predicted O-linked N-acetylglucosamine transferase (SPINDLY family)